MPRLHHILALATVSALCVGAASAQTASATERGNRLAYEAAMKCYIANGAAYGERADAGDEVAAARYERGARKSFDTAVKLGGVLGFSGSRIDQDFGLATARELPKLVADQAYNRQALAVCRAIGLM